MTISLKYLFSLSSTNTLSRILFVVWNEQSGVTTYKGNLGKKRGSKRDWVKSGKEGRESESEREECVRERKRCMETRSRFNAKWTGEKKRQCCLCDEFRKRILLLLLRMCAISICFDSTFFLYSYRCDVFEAEAGRVVEIERFIGFLLIGVIMVYLVFGFVLAISCSYNCLHIFVGLKMGIWKTCMAWFRIEEWYWYLHSRYSSQVTLFVGEFLQQLIFQLLGSGFLYASTYWWTEIYWGNCYCSSAKCT